jgi:tryptophan-rich sensory protein
MDMRAVFALCAFLLASFAAAGIGALATGPGVREWYPYLHKPPWTPPAWLFGPVWTALYLGIATAGFLAWRQAGFGGVRRAMALFAVQLVLNAAWSWVFFGLRQPGWGFVEICLLWAAIFATTVGLFRVSVWSGALFVPYLVWVTFAAALNLAIWRMNATVAG